MQELGGASSNPLLQMCGGFERQQDLAQEVTPVTMFGATWYKVH